ncbi:hypothetical protein GUJ93_ZPchr0006g42109 [Zizania palustris]|uniref:DUF676 domain-containing protein n=1 Tax=Zizania palustris TaxID=103762 RepID=A0A8J5SMI0_ZIZPA|nr:hypothetical protein GUJ93_ZPchr0006g42109 [Zizania palustris]
MASTLCSPFHHRSYYSRLRGRRPSGGCLGPSSAASGIADRPSGLNINRILCFHPKSITRGSPVSYSSMDVPQNKQGPDHLLILVHGIMASPSDWTYGEAVLKRRLGDNFFIYASSSNIYTKTFDGIDVAGRRLANEVLDVIQKITGLRKISFLAHSLGGLFARYAISILYSMETKDAGQCGACLAPTTGGSQKSECTSGLGAIAGLEPINFITLATPHLGVRGKNQLPFLQGLSILEKIAAPLAPLVVGRTGSQLFLMDGEPSKAPLLLQMSSDHEDKKFISALVAFKNRILYANVSYDHMVGWRTSSIRREKDLSKASHRSLKNYKHIVNVEYCSPVSSDGPCFRLQAAGAKEAAQNRPNRENTEEYHQMMQEEMIHGLQRVGWKKVDVNFHTALWPYFAHNNIHVKNEWLHNAGAGVIAHVADSIKQQESRKIFPANL